ncbi:MAG: adenylate/guanylate cyclase domain-containing protein [Flammeovirgaceae bacterium]
MNALDLYKTRKIAFFAIGGTLSALFYSLMEQMILHGAKAPIDCLMNNILGGILINLIFGCFMGIVVGMFEVFLFNKRMRSKNFGQLLWLKTGIYLLLFTFSAVMIVFTHAMYDLNAPIYHKAVVEQALSAIQGIYLPLFLIYVTTWVTGSIFLLQMSEKLGNGVLWQFLLGKYHRPKQEQRAFMFLDMKDSTSIAERIGSQKFYQLLNDFFADMTDTILRYQGEIYQYVGDEIIITWQVGKHDRAALIHCFYEIDQAIQKKGSYYLKQYGFIPEFKAGIHEGQVTVGEVGTIKREIVFSGDVLNTTSRIQGLCNQYETKLLVSDVFYALLPEMTQQIVGESMGKVRLKGKAEMVGIVKITPEYSSIYRVHWQPELPVIGKKYIEVV